MKIHIIILLLFILTGFDRQGNSAIAQPYGNDGPLLRRATIEYQALRYTAAIKELKEVLNKDPENLRAIEMMASSNRHIKEYDEALYWYGELCKGKHIKPEWALYFAEALANKERYEESEQWYRKYLTLKPNDRRAAAFSKANMSSFMNEGEWDIKYLNINTPASEYAPMFFKDGLLFVSNRQPSTRYVFEWDETPYTDLYVIDNLEDVMEGEEKSEEAEVEKTLSGRTSSSANANSLVSLFSQRGKKTEEMFFGPEVHLLRSKVRSTYHEGPAVLLPEGSLMFTRNNYNAGKAGKSKSGINKLKLYTATGNNWEKIVSFPYNNNEYSTGHPAISPDGSVLVFSSDMPRGYGGTDLYYCVRTSESGKWGRPVNLGPKINTEGNEQFPYLDKDGKLYFSSTGHPGLGGLDIFEVVLRDMKATTKPRNMGAGINSPSDDFSLIKSEDGKSGYFSSNRKGNDDIYQFAKLTYTVTLKGTVLDTRANRPLADSRVLLRHNGITDTIQTNAAGQFTRSLAKATDYEIGARRVAYIGREEFFSTTGITSDSTINVVLKMDQAANVQQWVVDNCASLKRTFNLNNIYYDLDKSDIREDAMRTLDEIANVMHKNPEISIISASHCDSRASEEYNRDLSLRRGRAARAYLISKGIDGSRIDVKYYGKSRLVNSCIEGVDCPESDQQMNRRTEFEVIINGVNLAHLDCTN